MTEVAVMMMKLLMLMMIADWAETLTTASPDTHALPCQPVFVVVYEEHSFRRTGSLTLHSPVSSCGYTSNVQCNTGLTYHF